GTQSDLEAIQRRRSPTRPAVNDELVRIFGDIGIEIIHQHPHCRFLMPAFAAHLAPARRVDDSLAAHNSSNLPERICPASRAMSPESGRSPVSADATSRMSVYARSTPLPP